MSRIANVLKSKNRLEKEARARRNREIHRMQREATYKANLKKSLNQVDILLKDNEIKSVIIEIPNKYLADFMRVMYESDMVEYSITQLSATKFTIGRKEVDF